MTSDRDTRLTPEAILAELTQMVWEIKGGHTDRCPPEQIPTFNQLDDVITATANNDNYNGRSCCLTGICYRNFLSF